MTIAWQFTDPGREYALIVVNGVLRTGAAQGASDATVRISRTGLTVSSRAPHSRRI